MPRKPAYESLDERFKKALKEYGIKPPKSQQKKSPQAKAAATRRKKQRETKPALDPTYQKILREGTIARQLAVAHSKIHQLQEEIVLLSRVADAALRRDHADVLRLWEKVTVQRFDPGRRRVYHRNFKLQVVQHYLSTPVGQRHTIAPFYGVDTKLVVKWVAIWQLYGDTGSTGGKKDRWVNPLHTPEAEAGVTPPSSPAPDPGRIDKDPCRIYIPKKSWEPVE